MTPDKLFGDPGLFALLFLAIVAKVEAVPMKFLVTILCGAVGALVMLGTNSVLGRLDKIEVNQAQIISRFDAKMERQEERNHIQDLCIKELQVRTGIKSVE